MSLVRLDLGCGDHKSEGYVGVDRVAFDGVDVVHDLENTPWPFEDNSVDQIYASNLVEHIHDLIGFMNEVYRILKPGANAVFNCPYYTSVRAWQDPTHVRAISEMAFLYYNKEWREREHLTGMGITCDFDFSYGFVWADEWKNRSDEAKAFAQIHYMNVITDIQVMLVKKQ